MGARQRSASVGAVVTHGHIETARRRTGYARVAVWLTVSAFIAVWPDATHRIWLLCVAVLALVGTASAEKVLPSDRLSMARAAIDTAGFVAFTWIAPGAWTPCLIMIGVVLSVTALNGSAASTVALTVPAVTALILAEVVQDFGHSLIGPVVVFLLAAVNLGLSLQNRSLGGAPAAVLSEALEAVDAIVHVTNLSTNEVELAQGPVEELTGWTADQWCALDHRDLIHPDDLAEFWVDTEVRVGEVLDRRARFRCKDGSWVWLRDTARVLAGHGDEVVLHGFTVDVTSLEEANRKIREQAATDELTSLGNRSRLAQEVARRLAERQSFSLYLLDLDRFKDVNDTLGHPVGDEVLQMIAKRLMELADPSDVVVRLGGDEFAIVRDQPARMPATDFALDIATAVSEPMLVQDIAIGVSASVGIAVAPRHGTDVPTLLRRADIAMYAAKRHGQTNRLFTASLEDSSIDDLTLSAEIGKGLETGQIVLHFQPVVSMHTGAVVGFEGLARWQHPTRGLLMPGSFVHLATLGDANSSFTRAVIDQGVQFAAVCAAVNPVPVSVNISARALVDAALPARVQQILERHGVDPSLLLIEITEDDLIDEAGRSFDVLNRLAALGVATSIDDFGTGHSSLSRLADIPISEIKIDRRFVAGAQDDDRNRAIVRSIIDLAANLKVDVVAEGVEREEDVEFLVQSGCEYAQGYLFAAALEPAVALSALSHGFNVVESAPQVDLRCS